ncbi:MAG: Gldg family protein [Immundisolibacter sp.]|uniref:Gldg family protein n=1 Tax=Immundisolibacter sp. TaxID=1934948 RepID=UPI003EE40038
MRRGVLSTGSLVLAVVLLLAVNILAATVLGGWRLDMTENRLYTLSAGSRAVVEKLEEPITLNLFFSREALRDVPQIQAYAARVQALLKEYAGRSHGKLQLKVIDPEPFSDAEDRAVQFGVRGLPLGGAGGETAYFGLAATNTTDGEEVIPFLSPGSEDTLEYDLTRLIYKLNTSRRPMVAVMSSLPVNGSMMPMQQQQTPAWAVIEQLRELFEVRVLSSFDKKIPDDADLLVLIHPKDLSAATQFAIDQYLLRRGRALVLLDPYSDVEPPQRDPIMPTMTLPKAGSDLGPLLSAWGMQIWPGVIGDREAARLVSFREDAPPQEYLVWLDLKSDRFDRKDIVTARLSQMYMNTVGALAKLPDSKIEFTPLISSSKQAMLVGTDGLDKPDPGSLLRDFKPGDEHFVMAARVQGTLTTAFPDGPPEGAEVPSEVLKQSAVPANLIVVADADFIYDRFWAQVNEFRGSRMVEPFADNGAFFINAVDNLTGSGDLIGVRSQGTYARPFTVVQAMNRAAQEEFRAAEQRLQSELQQTEQKLAELQARRGEQAGPLISAEQQREIERFQTERVRLRRELREVQHKLRQEIDRLETQLKFINIGLIPLLIGFAAALVALTRGRRRPAGDRHVTG